MHIVGNTPWAFELQYAVIKSDAANKESESTFVGSYAS